MTEPDAPATGTGTGTPPDEVEWRRLPVQMLLVGPATALLRLAPALVVLVLFGAGSGNSTQVWIAGAAVVVTVAAGVVRWRTTRYRITDERVELHSGLLIRQRRSVPRDRIRTVDLTAPLLHRIVGLSVVKVGSGQSRSDAGLDLDAVTTDEAERLRRELLARPATAAAGPATAATGSDPGGTGTAPVGVDGRDADGNGSAGGPADQEEPAGEELDRIDWSSLRYAPLTVSSLAAIGALAGAGWNLLNETGLDPRSLPGADTVAGELSTAPVWATVLVAVGALLLVMVVGSIVLFVERWWDYRLSREPDGTLRVRRGLLTKRSLSVSEQRLRGVTVSEPLLVRALGGGDQAGALAVGLAGDDADSGSGALGPPVRRAHAHTVAATATRATGPVTDGPLRAHPPRARTRRLVRAVGPALVPAAALGVFAWFDAAVWPVVVGPMVISAALVVVAVPLALDRYRALGHRLDEHYLVARHGSLLRTTTALRRDGVIGWRIRQSLFQRRAGVLTLEATTAAGGGSVQVLDLDPADAGALMAAVTPDPVAPFRVPPRVSDAGGSRTDCG
ncbi:PH domain-containing protein [Pseudonocardia sp. Ae505_Ps2]|uniref:PH domain-containing protein n=1 Tax=Pseudonocardia sp. Ae505_Ps2 TaxID=1885034 RepID=UPI00094EA943|nr:PH domain-containing protein [Pseudonocardia sp. Ae505_Ps2]OLM12840.1 transmembrane protein, ydbT [Pseudonocardia sp. Ae505_Ps2]